MERRLDGLDSPAAVDLRSVLDHLVRRSVWIVGGDGWAYDIGSGGLDHVLASGRNVNVLVLDTEVYSNTGGQMSKATPLGAVAKFASAGKTMPTKDLALQAIALANVYVARVAMGADPQQTLRAFREAEAYDGPSLVIAYSHCIAHGFDMRDGLNQQYRAVASGHWPLMRYDPVARATGGNPFLLDSPRPRMTLADYRKGELRFRTLANTDPAEAERLLDLAQQAADLRWRTYEEMATRQRRAVSRRTPAGSADGARHDATWVLTCATHLSRRRLRCRQPSTVCVASPTPASPRWCSTRSSRSSCSEEAEENARLVDAGTESFAESLTYFPAEAEEEPGARHYLNLLERAASAVDIPVIASLNGVTPGGWGSYAASMQDAGAAAIELNIYYLPGSPQISGRDVEQRHIDVLTRVKEAVTVPVAVKLSPHFSSIGEMAQRLDEAGADGLVLFNRFLQPDVDPETLARVPAVGLSFPSEARLPRTWIALLRGQVRASLAATTGVESPEDVTKLSPSRRRHRDDRIRTATAWPRVRRPAARRPFRVDGAQEVHHGGRVSWAPVCPAGHRRGSTRAAGLCQDHDGGEQQPLRSLVTTPIRLAGPTSSAEVGGVTGPGFREPRSSSGSWDLSAAIVGLARAEPS